MMPLYEAKMIHLYDTRWATYEPDGSTRLMTEDEKAQRVAPMPRYWVHAAEVDKKLGARWDKTWFLCWRDICRATDERTAIATLLPRVAVGNKIPIAMPEVSLTTAAQLQAVLSSFVLDFVARQKMGGTTMNYFIFMQLAVAAPGLVLSGLSLPQSVDSWVASRVERLNAWPADASQRGALRAELDAAMLHLYGVNRADAAYVLDTFPIVLRKDVAEYGEFRTKRLILEAYDAMAEAIRTGTSYRSPFTVEATS